MIIIKYSGGLGNQMFQYAIQIALENRFKNQIIKADISHYNLWSEHNGFELNKVFNIKLYMAYPCEIKPLTNNYIASERVRILPAFVRYAIVYRFQHWYRRIRQFLYPQKNKTDISDGVYNTYNSNVENLGKGSWYVHGVWQNTKYFYEYKDKIMEKFSLQCELTADDIKIVEDLSAGEAIAVHVRGGDFNNKHYDLCDRNYYCSALNLLGLNLPIYVYTDDISFAREKLSGFDIVRFISHDVKESKKDMYMISMSKYIVLSNSTFAFWGAYLSTIAKNVVAPKYARYDGKAYCLFPVDSEWMIIDNKR